MQCPQIIFREHALKRMFERSITVDAVEAVIESGDMIKQYPDDKPFASYLLLGYFETRPIHVLVSKDENTCFIITVYEPDPTIWQAGFKTKK